MMRRLLLTVLPCLALASPNTLLAKPTEAQKAPGVKTPSAYTIDFGTLPSGKALLQMESFSWGLRGENESKQVENQEMNVVIVGGPHSVALAELTAKQTEFKKITLTMQGSGSTTTFSLEGATISSYQTGGAYGDGGLSMPVDQVSIHFKKVTYAVAGEGTGSYSSTMDFGKLPHDR